MQLGRCTRLSIAPSVRAAVCAALRGTPIFAMRRQRNRPTTKCRQRLAAGGLWLALFALVPAPSGAETLSDALISAYLNNPRLLAQRAALRATDERVPQALSGYRPNVEASGSYGRRRTDSAGTFAGGVQNLDPVTGQVSVSQPLYRGGRTVASTREAENLVRAGRAQLAEVEQDVLLLAVSGYLNVLRDEAVAMLNNNNEQILRRQLEATRDRFSVGEVTRTDVAQAEARLSRATSDRIQAAGDLTSSRAAYKTTVGSWPTTLEPVPPLTGVPASENEAMAIALEHNPILLAAKFVEEASRHGIGVAKGGLLPTITLDGDLSHTEGTVTTGSQRDSAQIIAQLVVPLYQSGQVYSELRQSKQIAQQRRIEVEQVRRDVVEGVTTSWERLTTAQARFRSRSEEVRAAEVALEGVRQEAELGARTTLDVLDAEQELLNARVALVVARRDEYVAAFELSAAIGRLTADELGLAVEHYDPARNLNRVRDAWWGSRIVNE